MTLCLAIGEKRVMLAILTLSPGPERTCRRLWKESLRWSVVLVLDIWGGSSSSRGRLILGGSLGKWKNGVSLVRQPV